MAFHSSSTAGIVVKSLCFVFGALIAAEIAFVMPWGNDSGEPVNNAAGDVASIMPPDIDATIASILQRPLFAQSREGQESDEDGSAGDTSTFEYRLSGVAIGPNGREALFQSEGEKPVAVKLGGTIGGWTVTAIEPTQVEVKGRNGVKTVSLANGTGNATKPAPRIVRPAVAPRSPARPSGQIRLPGPIARQAAL